MKKSKDMQKLNVYINISLKNKQLFLCMVIGNAGNHECTRSYSKSYFENNWSKKETNLFNSETL